jgi:hypothetical protein
MTSVSHRIEWRQHLLSETRRLLKDRIGEILLCERISIRQGCHTRNISQLAQGKAHVF